jgi:hypothetical protein
VTRDRSRCLGCLHVDRLEDTGFHDADSGDPLEEHLAYDRRRYLGSSEFSRGSSYSEVRAIGHGRVDIVCIFPTHRFRPPASRSASSSRST